MDEVNRGGGPVEVMRWHPECKRKQKQVINEVDRMLFEKHGHRAKDSHVVYNKSEGYRKSK
jgi:hypothetical protein